VCVRVVCVRVCVCVCVCVCCLDEVGNDAEGGITFALHFLANELDLRRRQLVVVPRALRVCVSYM
jgi:hypothetical protein